MRLSCGVEALEVLIATEHHALIDVTHPVGLGYGEGKPDDNHDDESNVLAEYRLQDESEGDGYEEYDEFDDELEFVLHLVLSHNLVVQWQCGLVPYSQLEEQTVFWSCGEKQIGEYHQ